MGTIEIDFSEIASAEPTKPGVYDGMIKQVLFYHKDGNPYPSLDWTVELIEGDDAGREFHTYSGLGPKALWKVKEMFNEFGVDVTGLAQLEFDDGSGILLNPDFTGVPCRLKVINEIYEGRTVSKLGDLRATSNERPAQSGSAAPQRQPVAVAQQQPTQQQGPFKGNQPGQKRTFK